MDGSSLRDMKGTAEVALNSNKPGDIDKMVSVDDIDCAMVTSMKNVPLIRGDKQKKKKIKWRWRWKHKETTSAPVTQFSHDPPGHTCGLPCCSHDNEHLQVQQPTSQRGCVPVSMKSVADLSESNFFMKRTPVVANQKRNKCYRNKSDYKSHSDLISINDDNGHKESSQTCIPSSDGDVAPSAEMIGLQGPDYVNQLPNLCCHRNLQTLPSCERQRHITLPDCPQRQHTIMFLNHHVGETSDFSEVDTQKVADVKQKEPHSSSETTVQQQSSSSTDGNNQVSRYSTCVSETNSSDGLLNQSPDTGSGTRKKRLAHSKLPDVPIEKDDPNIRREDAQASLVIDTDDMADDTSSVNDHVYDVLSEVREHAEKLSQRGGYSNPISEPEIYPTVSVSDMKPFSDLDSTSYQDTDISLGSYIYNGSLLSYGTNDSDSLIHYSEYSSKHRFYTGNLDYPPFKPGQGKGKVSSPRDYLTDPKLEKTSKVQGKASGNYNNEGCSVNENNAYFYNKKKGIDCKTIIKVDEFHLNRKRSSIVSDDMSVNNINSSVSSGLSLDSDTKLRLLDLRLIAINSEQNHYSTFPLRKQISDETSVRYFSRTPKLGYRHRHNSDVSADHYITHKMERILRSPVLTKYGQNDQAKLHFVQNDKRNIFKTSDIKLNINDQPLNSLEQLLKNKQESKLNSRSIHDPVTHSSNYLHDSWTRPFINKSDYEPITLSGKYKQTTLLDGNKCSNNTDHFNISHGHGQSTHSEHSALSPTPKNSTLNSDASSLCSGSDVSYKSHLPGGSTSCSRSSGYNIYEKRHSHSSATSTRSVLSNSTYTTGNNQDYGRGNVVWTQGDSHVDWRRQAQLYRDNNLITLIL